MSKKKRATSASVLKTEPTISDDDNTISFEESMMDESERKYTYDIGIKIMLGISGLIVFLCFTMAVAGYSPPKRVSTIDTGHELLEAPQTTPDLLETTTTLGLLEIPLAPTIDIHHEIKASEFPDVQLLDPDIGWYTVSNGFFKCNELGLLIDTQKKRAIPRVECKQVE